MNDNNNNNTVLFCDVDGVFTSARISWYNWDIYAVNFILWCCKESGAKVVISSTWRFNNNKEFFQGIFGEYLHEDWKTPNFPTQTRKKKGIRGDDIESWLNIHPEVTDYLIIDDDPDFHPDQKENGRFIRTDSTDGMLFDHMMKIRDYLKIQSFPKDQKILFQHPNMFEENYWKKYHKEDDPRNK